MKKIMFVLFALEILFACYLMAILPQFIHYVGQ
jgi:hypothetical protein